VLFGQMVSQIGFKSSRSGRVAQSTVVPSVPIGTALLLFIQSEQLRFGGVKFAGVDGKKLVLVVVVGVRGVGVGVGGSHQISDVLDEGKKFFLRTYHVNILILIIDTQKRSIYIDINISIYLILNILPNTEHAARQSLQRRSGVVGS
jgi:hypothetical protein